jgi:hypothetical protein
VSAIFEELQGFLGPLLLKRRSGIIAALVAACGRAGICQREACTALAQALSTLPQWQGREGGRGEAAGAGRAGALQGPAAGEGQPWRALSLRINLRPLSLCMYMRTHLEHLPRLCTPSTGTAHLAPALMTLDTAAAFGSSSGGGGAGAAGDDGSVRLSTPGCALLAAILGFPKVRSLPPLRH